MKTPIIVYSTAGVQRRMRCRPVAGIRLPPKWRKLVPYADWRIYHAWVLQDDVRRLTQRGASPATIEAAQREATSERERALARAELRRWTASRSTRPSARRTCPRPSRATRARRSRRARRPARTTRVGPDDPGDRQLRDIPPDRRAESRRAVDRLRYRRVTPPESSIEVRP